MLAHLAALALLPILAQPESPPATTPQQALQKVADDWFTQVAPPGATLTVIDREGRETQVAVGLARKEPPMPMKPGDRMMSGSIGKTFVAAVMLQLVGEGRADLDAKLSTWLGERPWFARVPNAGDITLRMLLNHTSGIPEHVTAPDFVKALAADRQKAWTPEELAAFCLDKPALFPAGKGWGYADTNYIFVGMVIEKITGNPYTTELRERLLIPHGLSSTTPVEGPDLPGMVSGYTRPGKPFEFPEEVCVDGTFAINPQFEWTGGGLSTTSRDLAHWARRLYSGHVVAPALLTQMLDSVPAKTGPGDEYGLGVQVWTTERGRVIGHSGYFPGYIACMAWYPREQIAVAVQVNSDQRPGALKLRPLLDRAAAAVARE